MAEKTAAWPTVNETHPISVFRSKLDDILTEAGYDEVYGIDLRGASQFHQNLILQKFLRANANNVDAARSQLLATLKWRKTFGALKTKEDAYSRKRFGGLGYVTTLTGVPESENDRDVATFNIYGAVKDNKTTFGDVDGFMRWRVGLMEVALEKLDLALASRPIPDYGTGPDPYQAIQIHDYLSVSFLRQDPNAKAAAKKAIEVFQAYYPETLSRKLFVNVPVIMGWFYNAMTMVLSKETVKKFKVISYGKDVASILGPNVPTVYGGNGGSLDTLNAELKMVD